LPIRAAAAEVYAGVPVVPLMTTWATDGIYTTAAGIPTYGLQGFFLDPDQGNMHGLNERIRVQSLLDGRAFHYRLERRTFLRNRPHALSLCFVAAGMRKTAHTFAHAALVKRFAEQ
jgi:hypothetical protein